VGGKSFSSRSSSSRAIRCRITHLCRSGLASKEVGFSWVRLLTSEWVLGRAGSMYLGALGETSKWGLKKKLSKKKNIYILILLLY
jgi:hypothetical protein